VIRNQGKQMAFEDELIDEFAAAKYITKSVAYLRDSRSKGLRAGRTAGPPFYKLGAAVRYKRRELDAWLAAHRVDPAQVGKPSPIARTRAVKSARPARRSAFARRKAA
jgi:hypothetical protein